MPTRYLRPGIRDSESIEQLSPLAETLFYRLLVTVDDFGRTDARPAMVKASCFPIKDSVTATSCRKLLDELRNAGLIRLYEANGKPYLELSKWDNPPRAKESRFPAPPPTSADTTEAAEVEDGADADGLSADVAQLHTSVCKPRTLLPDNREPRTVEPGTANREPLTANREPKTAGNTLSVGVHAPPTARRRTGDPPATAEAWQAYASAFIARYGCDPVRNATVNGQMAQFVKRLGADEAPMVAGFYLGHNGAAYVRLGHSVGAMLKDAEKLRTEWVTRRQITSTGAMQADRTQTNFDAFAPLLAKARAEAASAH